MGRGGCDAWSVPARHREPPRQVPASRRWAAALNDGFLVRLMVIVGTLLVGAVSLLVSGSWLDGLAWLVVSVGLAVGLFWLVTPSSQPRR